MIERAINKPDAATMDDRRPPPSPHGQTQILDLPLQATNGLLLLVRDLNTLLEQLLDPLLQAIFGAAEYLSLDDEFWPALMAAAEQAYGAERAAEILAPSA